jgi:hypothetical protein
MLGARVTLSGPRLSWRLTREPDRQINATTLGLFIIAPPSQAELMLALILLGTSNELASAAHCGLCRGGGQSHCPVTRIERTARASLESKTIGPKTGAERP